MVAGGREVEGWSEKGGGGMYIVSSPTIPAPNQPLFISFSLPINVIPSKWLLKRL